MKRSGSLAGSTTLSSSIMIYPIIFPAGKFCSMLSQPGLIRPPTRIIAISGVPTNNERLLELGAHVALDKNSLYFYDQVKQLVSLTQELGRTAATVSM